MLCHPAREFETAGHGGQLLLVPTREMLDGHGMWLRILLDFLELPSSPVLSAAYQEAVAAARSRAHVVERQLPPRTRKAVLAALDDKLEAWWRDRIDEQVRSFRDTLNATVEAPRWGPTTTTPRIPTTARAEAFDALKAAPGVPDEKDERIDGQMREIAERGQRLTALEGELEAVGNELAELAETGADREAERRRLEAELEETRTERAQALERLSAERVASHSHRIQLEHELADARVAWSQAIEGAETRRDELVAAVAECKRLRSELSAARAAATRERERVGTRSQAALAAATVERERVEAELGEAQANAENRLEQLRARTQAELAALREQADVALTERGRLEARLAAAQEQADAAQEQADAAQEQADVALSERERLEAGLAAAQEQADDLRSERQHLETELRSSELERAELSRRLGGREEELQGAVRNLAAIEGATASLEQAFTELRSEAHELRVQRSSLAERIDVLSLHNEGLHQALSERDRGESALRSTISTLEDEVGRRQARTRALQKEAQRANAELQRAGAELRASGADRAKLELRVSALERERELTVEGLRRVASSRAWRWGHGTTRLLRRITFRRSVRAVGGVEQMLERLDPPPALPAGESAAAESEPSKPR